MGSSRLPGKVMMMVEEGKPVINWVLSQLNHCKLIDKIIVASTSLPEDEQIIKYVKNLGFDCFRGSSNDVLDRYYECAKEFSISNIVRITSDNPLIDPTIVDNVITKFYSDSFDYVANCIDRTFPYGTETEIFTFEALKTAWMNSNKPPEREHVTQYIKNNPNKFKISDIKHHQNISHLKWSVDRSEDIELVKLISQKIKRRPILMTDILELIKRNPNIVKLKTNAKN